MLSSDQVSESGPKVCQGRTADSLDIGVDFFGPNHDLATRWGRDPESASNRVPLLHHSLVEQQVQAALMEDRPPILHLSLLEHQGQDALMKGKPSPPGPQNTTIRHPSPPHCPTPAYSNFVSFEIGCLNSLEFLSSSTLKKV